MYMIKFMLHHDRCETLSKMRQFSELFHPKFRICFIPSVQEEGNHCQTAFSL